MSSIRAKGLVLAMESEEEVISNPSDIEESMAEIAESSSEIDRAESDVVEIDNAIDDASEDAETLGRIKEVMENSVEEGEGLDETAAEIAEVAIEAICVRLGVQKRVMPAMESFGSNNSRVTATKIAIEGVSEVIKNIWDAIVAAYKKMTDFIKEFLTKWLTALGRSKEAIKKMETSVKEFGKTEVEADKKVENSGLATMFNVGGKADASTVKQLLANHVEYTNSVLKASDKLKKAVSNFDAGKVTSTRLYAEAKEYVSEVSSKSPQLVNNTVIEVEQPKAEEEGFSIKFNLSFGGDKNKLESLPVLSKSEMEDILKEASGLLSVSETFKKEIKVIEDMNNSVMKIAKEMNALVSKVRADQAGEDKQASEDAKKASKLGEEFLKSVKSVVSSTSTTIPNLNIKAINGSLSYINASMKSYK